MLRDSPIEVHRPFNVSFFKDDQEYSSNYLGQVVVWGGVTPDPDLGNGTNVTVDFLWTNAPAGNHNITARVDITDNDTADPPDPDRINEVEEWTNNQISSDLLVVPEFREVLIPIIGTAVIVLFIRRRRGTRGGRGGQSGRRNERVSSLGDGWTGSCQDPINRR